MYNDELEDDYYPPGCVIENSSETQSNALACDVNAAADDHDNYDGDGGGDDVEEAAAPELDDLGDGGGIGGAQLALVSIYNAIFMQPDGLFRSSALGEVYFGGASVDAEDADYVCIADRCLDNILPALAPSLSSPPLSPVTVMAEASPASGNAPPKQSATAAPPVSVMTPPTPSPTCAKNAQSFSNMFSSLETPLGFKESPATKFMHEWVRRAMTCHDASAVTAGGGILFPVDSTVNRSALQRWICGDGGDSSSAAAETEEDAAAKCPWYTAKKEGVAVDVDAEAADDASPRAPFSLAAIRRLKLSKELIHVGYVMSLPANVALIAIGDENEGSEGESVTAQLLKLIPEAELAFSANDAALLQLHHHHAPSSCEASGAVIAHIMSRVFPFLKAKSSKDAEAIALAEAFMKAKDPSFVGYAAALEAHNAITATSNAQRLANDGSTATNASSNVRQQEKGRGALIIERHSQEEVAAIRKAHKVLKDKQTDPWQLASFIIGREVKRPPPPPQGVYRPLLSTEDAEALATMMMRTRWLCIDFEAASVGKYESSTPIEVGVVEAFAKPPTASDKPSKSPLSLPSDSLLAHAAEEDQNGGSKYTPYTNQLLNVIRESTQYFAMIHPGRVGDRVTAVTQSLIACPTRKKGEMTVTGHGIPFTCLNTLRTDYRRLAAELVASLGIGELVRFKKDKDEGKEKERKEKDEEASRCVLINKGPTFVDFMCLRWCLAAANVEAEAAFEARKAKENANGDNANNGTATFTPIYDLSMEAASLIPMFEVGTVGELVGMVKHALTEAVVVGGGGDGDHAEEDEKESAAAETSDDKATAAVLEDEAGRSEEGGLTRSFTTNTSSSGEGGRLTRRQAAAATRAAEASMKLIKPLPSLPSRLKAKMLCACGYHWDLYTTDDGMAVQIANEAEAAKVGGGIYATDGVESDDFMISIFAEEDVDVHCARSDAFYLKCQMEDLLSKLA